MSNHLTLEKLQRMEKILPKELHKKYYSLKCSDEAFSFRVQEMIKNSPSVKILGTK